MIFQYLQIVDFLQVYSHILTIFWHYYLIIAMLSLMKGFTSFGAIIILIIGLAMLGITIFGYVSSDAIFLDNTAAKQLVLGILLGADLFIILGSLVGICGIRKGKGGLICIFQIIVMIFLLIFLGLGIGAMVLPQTVFNGDCNSSNNPMVAVAKQLYQNSTKLFCMAPECTCLITPAMQNSYSDDEWSYLSNKNNYPNQDPVTGFSSTQRCLGGSTQNQTIATLLNIVGQLQDLLDCSQWCSTAGPNDNLLYRFSNTQNGKPQAFCYDAMKGGLATYGHIIGAAALGTTGFLLLLCICNLAICCDPKRKRLSYRDRFVYQGQDGYRRV